MSVGQPAWHRKNSFITCYSIHCIISIGKLRKNSCVSYFLLLFSHMYLCNKLADFQMLNVGFDDILDVISLISPNMLYDLNELFLIEAICVFHVHLQHRRIVLKIQQNHALSGTLCICAVHGSMLC